MFERFKSHLNECAPPLEALNNNPIPVFGVEGEESYFREVAGRSFNDGLYVTHDRNDCLKWTNIVIEAFPEYENRIRCFARDWLGRQFALDRDRRLDRQMLVLMLEPGTGEALEIPSTLTSFHNEELVDHSNEVLASDFFQSWITAGNRPPNRTECVGYKTPLFLGGQDAVENLEIADLEVYWGLMPKLIRKARNLPLGTKINTIDVS